MKKIIYCYILIFFSYSIILGQKISNNNVQTLESTQNFKTFLDFFIPISPPFNYKKEILKVPNSIMLKEIPENLASTYMHMQGNDFVKLEILYNMDTDESRETKEKYLPVSHLKYSTTNFIAAISRESMGIKKDSFTVCLRTYDQTGNLIDKAIIGARYTREDDWKSFVFLDQYHFRVFQYNRNWNNYDKNYNIIDKNNPLTKVTVSDFEIEKDGLIRNVKKSPLILLKKDIMEYKIYNPEIDDPMNKY